MLEYESSNIKRDYLYNYYRAYEYGRRVGITEAVFEPFIKRKELLDDYENTLSKVQNSSVRKEYELKLIEHKRITKSSYEHYDDMEYFVRKYSTSNLETLCKKAIFESEFFYAH